MIAALLLAAVQPAPMSAIDAERAFVADAQKLGQWTAFRKWATPDALMFVPQPIKAHDFLKDRKDPPVSVYWWPGRSYVSCDGTVAINTGPWVRGFGKSVGYFTTVWVKQPDGGWKWVYDAGDELPAPRAEGGDVKPIVASCRDLPRNVEMVLDTSDGTKSDSGRSPDESMNWIWEVRKDGARYFTLNFWDGEKFVSVIKDEVAAPPKP